MSSLTPQSRAQPDSHRSREPNGRGGGARQWPRTLARTIFYPLFSLVLIVPRLRSWRRRAFWPWVRLALVTAAVVLVIVGHAILGTFLLVAAAIGTSLADPDALQNLADRLGARYVLNGGDHSGVAMHLFLTPTELLLVPVKRPASDPLRFPLDAVEDARIDGVSYRPTYVAFAKAPPTRDTTPSTNARSELEIVFKDRPPLRLSYRGAFASHLAEVAAHTIRMRTGAVPTITA